MAVFKIVSVGLRPTDNKKYREEYIDTKKNKLFSNAKTERGVADKYNRFWSGDAKAVQVEKVAVKSRGENWGMKFKPKGWKFQPMRHSLAARGIKTGKKRR